MKLDTRGLLLSVVVLSAQQSLAIEAPKANAPAPQPAAPATQQPTPAASDESAFYQRLQYSTHFVNLRDLSVPNDVLVALSQGHADVAVNALEASAAKGSSTANIALVRIQHWCASALRPGEDPQKQIAALPQDLAPERAARAAGVINARAAFLPRAMNGCRDASFNYRAIEARLRSAAETGDAASATELAQFVRDPQQRETLLKTAAAKNYAPALYATATQHLMAVQRGQTTEDVASIRLQLKQAGRTLARARVDLANCMALGCDGHPADALTAQAFGVDAARDGEPIAFLSMPRMPWGYRLSRAQLLGWQMFGDRLNEQGCFGDEYVGAAIAFAQTIKGLEREQDPAVVDQGRATAQTLWKDNAERVMKERGCADPR
ncbi:MAG TPA: hypothetical protein VFS47_09310 [Steroidobacteraceae bacterium]|nr:hypothetical protein [Steroidobacteraceae bacterium]